MTAWAAILLVLALSAVIVGVRIMRSADAGRRNIEEGALADFGGLLLTEHSLVERIGSRTVRHPRAGLSARVVIKSAVNNRVTAPRVLLLGVLALAVKKKHYETEAHLVIEGPELEITRAESLRRNPTAGEAAREFAALLNGTGRTSTSVIGAARETVGEPERFDVALLESGVDQVAVVRAVRQVVRGLGLLDAKELVTGTPSILLQQVSAGQAAAAKERLEHAGATVELL